MSLRHERDKDADKVTVSKKSDLSFYPSTTPFIVYGGLLFDSPASKTIRKLAASAPTSQYAEEAT